MQDPELPNTTTAPSLSAEERIRELEAEIASLKQALDHRPPEDSNSENRLREIRYHEQPFSNARLSGLTEDRDRIGSTSDFEELPKPTTNISQLESDFIRWGYCLVENAITKTQIQAQIDRLIDQAEAEREAGVAHMSHRGRAQLNFNMLPKGKVFRELIALEENAAHRANLVEDLLEKILGKGFYLGTAHGSIVHQGGGRQELHQDQGFVPLPHPPYPLLLSDNLVLHGF